MKKIALLMSLILLAGCLFGCQKDPVTPGEGSTEEPGLQGVDLPLVKNGEALYHIVYPENCSKALRNAVTQLTAKLEAMTGATFRASDDYTRDGKPADSTGEIIIGNCRRTDTQNALARLRQKDFSVMATENNILILAWDDSYATKGVNWLIEQLTEQALTVTGGSATLRWEGSHTESGGFYRYESVSVGENSLFDYRIVYPAAVGDGNAKEVQGMIASATGYRLAVVSDSEAAQPLEILVGSTNRAESQAFADGSEKLEPLEYTITVRNQKIVILGADEFSQARAITLFQLDLNGCQGSLDGLRTEGKSLLSKNIPTASAGSYRFMQYNILVEYENWGSGGIIKPEISYRQEPVTGLILNYAPDAAVLCEVFPGWRAVLPELLGDVYGFAELDRANGEPNRTPIIYKKDKFNLVESGYRDIGVKTEAGSPMYRNYRVVTWAVLEDKATGQRVAVFGTHWENASYTSEDRKQQAAAMTQVIAEITAKYQNIPVVAMGDFNCRGNSEEYIQLLRDANLTDGLASVTDQMIDHIALRGATVAASGVETTNCAEYASDHKPIWCDVRFQ